jgi:electron transport complex protein RnfC
LKGVAVPHRKNTRDSATVDMPVPEQVFIVMSQHMGPPCDVLVSPKDEVKVGQVLGDTSAFLSAPIHSSVSGTVLRIDEIIMPNGVRSKAVVIQADGLQELSPDIKPPVLNTRAEFINAVHASGIVGLGGAGFPTHIKLNPKDPSALDTLVINAAECEPYITSDYRAIMEDAADILEGVHAMLKFLNIPKCVIGVEDNKPEAIKRLEELTANEPKISVKTLKSKYPQGAEKVLIYETTGRTVGEGQLPADVGVVVCNVTTADKIAHYLRDGIPLISKRVTVDGGAVKEPKNVNVLIGTPIIKVLEFCGGFKAEPKKLIMGGPMMGTAVYDENYPIIKNNNAILAFDEKQVEEYSETDCIRCGRCVLSCPFNLMPLRIEDAFNKEDNEALEKYKVNLCMECGCCAYACPAKRHLVQVHRLAKARLRAAQAKKQKGA